MEEDILAKKLQVYLDTNPSGGCGCNCGCGGSTVVEDMTDLVESLKEYQFSKELNVDLLPIDNMDVDQLVTIVNSLLDNTNAVFRVNKDTVGEALDNMLPLVVLDDTILTAYGVPTLSDVVFEVERNM